MSALHEERLDTVTRYLLESGATSVLDLGCGRGELLQRLVCEPRFTRIVGIDIDQGPLAEARDSLGLAAAGNVGRVQVRYGSFEESDPDLAGFDAAALVETIEHIDPRRLSRVEGCVFGIMRPRTVLITTPNQEYNLLHGLAPGQRRHLGHRFEWTRAKFRQWARGVAARKRYRVDFIDVGPPAPLRGSSTQMARLIASTAPDIGSRN
ncbi:MAG: methyltransferase domain-containing protein [Nitrosospira sp.]|nr:methyltransferase domain-containing protein [Nitrosospira sp.]